MKMKKSLILLSIASMIALSACGNEASQNNPANNNQGVVEQGAGHAGMDHGDMNHSSSGEVPAGLKEAKTPAFPVGSQVIMNTDHMEGMKGATATIVGAYDTTVYAISYTPTTGGPKVTNHKWVIHEELKDAAAEPFKPGDQVVVQADHMKGMSGATATIDTAEQTTVYMLDYTPTTGGEVVKNHKWFVGSELSAK